MARHLKHDDAGTEGRQDVPGRARSGTTDDGTVVYLGIDKPKEPREPRRHGRLETWEAVSIIVVPLAILAVIALASWLGSGLFPW